MKKCSLSRMIGPLNVAPYCSVSSSVLKPRSSSIGDGSRQASDVRSQKKLPRHSLVPDLVTATTAALLIWSYSALRSEEHTSELQSLMRNSYAVFRLTKKHYYTKTKNT